MKMNKMKWFNFSTRDLVIMAIMVGVAGLFQVLWAQLVYQAQVLGPFVNLFGSLGFNLVSFLILFLVRKPGACFVVKTLSGVVEVLWGSPVGLFAIFYNAVEGIATDLAFVWFKGNFSLNMIVAGSLMAWIFAAPVDAWRDAVPMTVEGLVGYFGPGGMGKVWISLWIYLAIKYFAKAGLKPLSEPKEKPVVQIQSE
jgi:ABC-type thiamin/hydroxymethylpyrimidine transport system permease subunit